MEHKKTHLIKRYQNRKLYDTSSSSYVTLNDIEKMVREGKEVKVVDNRNREDLTTVTLAQIIFEQEKKTRSLLPLDALKQIIQNGGEQLAQFVQKTVGTGISQARTEAERYLEKIKTPLTQVSGLSTMQLEMRSLQKKIEELEAKLKKGK